MTNYSLEFCAIDELCDCEPANRNDKTWSQNFEFGFHPAGTIPNFVRCRHPVASASGLARETTNDSSKINALAHRSFVQIAKFFEPTEQGFASGVSERALQRRFAHARSLSNDHDIAANRPTGNGRRNYPRTTPAAAKTGDMIFQQFLSARFQHPIVRNSLIGRGSAEPMKKSRSSEHHPIAGKAKRSDLARC